MFVKNLTIRFIDNKKPIQNSLGRPKKELRRKKSLLAGSRTYKILSPIINSDKGIIVNVICPGILKFLLIIILIYFSAYLI